MKNYWQQIIGGSFIVLIMMTTALPATAALPAAGPLKDLFPQTDGYFIHKNCLGDQTNKNECGLPEIMLTAINVTRVILGLVGSVTLLIFVYGGLIWITAAGNTQRVEHGRKVFESAVIGLIIIFTSWLIINFIVGSLMGTAPGEKTLLFPGGNDAIRRPPLEIRTK